METPRRTQPIAGITRIGGFEILEKLGQGGMGAVYKARQVSLDRIVALKVLKPSLSKDLEFIARFRREALASAKLNHPNIVQGIDVGCDKGMLYFAMEYVEGRSLQQILDKEGALDEEEATGYVRQVAEALVCAHKAGLVHRDIKPDNILVTMDGTAKLADMGLAKGGTDSSLTDTGTVLGTPYYMSPEQARGDKDIDTRSDLYSLGATWFHMVTGRVPFSGNTAASILLQHLNGVPPKAHRINQGVSAGASRLIDRLLRKDRNMRVATPNQLLEQIDALDKDNELQDVVMIGFDKKSLRTTIGRCGSREVVRPKFHERKKSVVVMAVGGAVVFSILVVILWGNRKHSDQPNIINFQTKKGLRSITDLAPNLPVADEKTLSVVSPSQPVSTIVSNSATVWPVTNNPKETASVTGVTQGPNQKAESAVALIVQKENIPILKINLTPNLMKDWENFLELLAALQPQLQGNLSQAAETLLRHRGDFKLPEARAWIDQECRDLKELQGLREQALEFLRGMQGQQIELDLGKMKLAGKVSDSPLPRTLTLRAEGGVEINVTAKDLSAEVVDRIVPLPESGRSTALRLRGLLFLAAGLPDRARKFLDKAEEAGLRDECKAARARLERIESHGK